MNKCFSTNFHCSVFANEPPFFIEPTCGKLAIADCFNIDYRCRLHPHQKAKIISSFTHPHGIQNPFWHAFFGGTKQKIFWELLSCMSIVAKTVWQCQYQHSSNYILRVLLKK